MGFTDEAAFTYAAKVTSIYKKVVAEILAYMNNSIAETKHLKDKERGKLVDKFTIGKEGE